MNWFSRLSRAAHDAYCDLVTEVACRLLWPIEQDSK